MSDESTIVESKLECTINGGCGSSDAMALYDDGHKFCFSCEAVEAGEGGEMPQQKERRGFDPLPMQFIASKKRRLDADTCRKFGYGEGNHRTMGWVAMYNVYEDGAVVAQKVRGKDKQFTYLGNPPKNKEFFGQRLFDKGKKLVITEGELDCLSVSQVFQNKYPVVSLPDGAGSAKRTIKAHLPWLSKFEEIVLCFDQDEAGEKATQQAVKLLPPGKAKICKLPLKDASDMLMKGMEKELVAAVYDAKLYRPDTVMTGGDLTTAIFSKYAEGALKFPHTGVQEKLLGTRGGEITLFGAGTGVGKTTIVKQVLAHDILQGSKVGGFFLEEVPKRSAMGLAAAFCEVPIHMRMLSGQGITAEERAKIERVCKQYVEPNVFLFKESITKPDELLAQMRYFAVGLGCDVLALDHITMLANLAASGAERELLDNTMNRIAALIKELDIQLRLVSHLKRPPGTPHEEGGPVRQGDFRGSTQIAALSHNIIGVERDQQGSNKLYTHLRVLKCRETGRTGSAGWMKFDEDRGILVECEEPEGGIHGKAETSGGFGSEESY